MQSAVRCSVWRDSGSSVKSLEVSETARFQGPDSNAFLQRALAPSWPTLPDRFKALQPTIESACLDLGRSDVHGLW